MNMNPQSPSCESLETPHWEQSAELLSSSAPLPSKDSLHLCFSQPPPISHEDTWTHRCLLRRRLPLLLGDSQIGFSTVETVRESKYEKALNIIETMSTNRPMDLCHTMKIRAILWCKEFVQLKHQSRQLTPEGLPFPLHKSPSSDKLFVCLCPRIFSPLRRHARIFLRHQRQQGRTR